MKASMIKVLGTLAAGLVGVAASSASAQLYTTANGPYYTWPSWDQKLTTNRFVILANWNSEAVLDRESSLVWHRSLSPTVFSGFADQGCLNSATGGRAAWRLPGLQLRQVEGINGLDLEHVCRTTKRPSAVGTGRSTGRA